MESRKLMTAVACITEVASANTMAEDNYGCQVVCEIYVLLYYTPHINGALRSCADADAASFLSLFPSRCAKH